MVTAIRNELSDTGVNGDSTDGTGRLPFPRIIDPFPRSVDGWMVGLWEVKQSAEREREGGTVEKRFISEILGWREETAMVGAQEIRIHRGGGELERREIFLIS